jgi:protoporphyrinogen oxidase
MKCRDISADWAAQRIRGLSLSRAIWNALIPKSAANRRPSGRPNQITSLIDSFRYPRLGPGMMWEEAARRTKADGGKVLMGHRATSVERLPAGATHAFRVHVTAADGSRSTVDADHVISSAPLRELVAAIEPQPPAEVRTAAAGLRYRDFITVALIVRPSEPFDDNWIYIHDPGVKVGRVQNFGSWSPELVPDPSLACYGLEYFCFEGDGLWTSTDADLVRLATSELVRLGLVREGDILDGHVVRQPKAYPVYDDGYADHVETIRAWLTGSFPGLHLVGRNGMHKYNNQDHSMMTAMLVARNILAGRAECDPWLVNEDAEYHEAGARGRSGSASGLRLVPTARR